MSARRYEGASEVETPRRPQRLKRSTPVPRTDPSPLVLKLRSKFESSGQEQQQYDGEAAAPRSSNGVSQQLRGDSLYSHVRKNLQPARNGSGADRPAAASGGAARGTAVFRKHAVGEANRTSVLQRARQYERASSDTARQATPPRSDSRVGGASSSPVKSAAAMSGCPPVKPPRTFAHDIYAESKQQQQQQLRANPLYGKCARGSVPSRDDAYDEVCATPADRAVLRRSRSEEHIYAEPGAALTSDRSAPPELHYMSSPISGAVQDGGALSPGTQRGARAFTSLVRDAINQSFTLRKSSKPGPGDAGGDTQADSSSEVSVKDIEKRLVYVRSIKRAAYVEGPSCDSCGPPPQQGLLEFVLVVGYRRVDPAMAPQPDVLHRFFPATPPHRQEEEEECCPGYDPVVISHLCMPQPFDSEDAASPERRLFFFTLVQSGEKTFFHCLQMPKSGGGGALAGSVQTPVVLCLATKASAPAFYRKLLGQMERPLLSLDRRGWEQLLSALAKQGLPSPGCRLVCQCLPPTTTTTLGGRQRGADVAIAFTRPLDDHFDWARLTPLLGVLEAPVLLRIVSSLILERRLILVSADCDLVRGWVESVESLTYPFRWPHVRVPLVPKSLLAQCSSPEPYLLGVHASLAHTALELLGGGGPVLVVDMDHGVLLREDEDNRDVVPDKLQRSLCTALSLAKNMTDPTGRVRDVMITEAFLRLFVELVGHCDQHLCPSSLGFQREAFVRAPASRGAQMFLQWFVETQAFELFLQERTQRLRQLARTPHHHLLPKGLFERRAAEYLLDLEQSGRGLRELGRRVRTIGERFWNLKAFQRD